MVGSHDLRVVHTADDAAANRYLDLVAKAVLDELAIEHAVRIAHLLDCVVQGQRLDVRVLRDPRRQQPERLAALLAARRAGRRTTPDDGLPAIPSAFPDSEMGVIRLRHLRQCLDHLRTTGVEGDLVEVGTGRGGGAVFLRAYLDAFGLPDRAVWVADRFRPASGTASGGGPDGGPDGASADLLADLNTVRDAFARFGLLDERVKLLQGEPADTLSSAGIGRVALLRIGPPAAGDVGAVLDVLYDRVALGGVVVVDGADDPRVARALDDFRDRRGVGEPVERVDHVARTWRKDHPPTIATGRRATGAVHRRQAGRAHAPLAAPVPLPPLDLSVVVVFHDMRREAARTLHSLSRAYQRDVEDLDYEVLVVENGSAPEQRLGEDLVRSFGPEFRYLDLGAHATPTPVDALNRGIACARGVHLALMIDGAHVLTPGVLHYGMLALRSHHPAVVATQQWYMGPGQQPDTTAAGYEQGYEDRLFEAIAWPTDGYRLFDIGHFVGDRDWFDAMIESNCLFAPRTVLEQVGAYDEAFSMPGGGYANLDLYERLGSTPGVRLVTLLGEGSFHQVHGGTTTNASAADERTRRIAEYATHYAALRGRPYLAPTTRMHFVGTMRPGAMRTKPRRLVAPEFRTAAPLAIGPDGIPTTPVPVPDELREEYVDAYWRTLAWRDTTWLGRRVGKPPGDLFAYQELVAHHRPEWIIETRTGSGGRAHFFAGLLDLLGSGQVVTIDGTPTAALEHPRIHQIVGEPWGADVLAQVRALVGDDPHALVVLGGRSRRRRVLLEFDALAPFVPVGSHVVVEDTIVNGHPVWTGFGPGPAEAVHTILRTRDDFVADRSCERHGVSFNPGGYLRRVR